MDTLITRFQTDEAIVAVSKLPEPDELLRVYMLSTEEQALFSKITSEKRKREFIGIRIVLTEILGKKPELTYDADGKPFLTDKHFYISLSHCSDMVTAIAHPTCKVGIDIEPVSSKIERLVSRFLNLQEQTDFANLHPNNLYYTLCWSAKEAIYKLIGKSAVDFGHHLQVLPFEMDDKKRELKVRHIPSGTDYLVNYMLINKTVLTYVIDKK